METLTEKLLAGRIVEFSYQDKTYLIQQENNKGWNYLSLWRTDPNPACLNRAFFDIFDGLSMETIAELFSQPSPEGCTVRELLQASLDEDPLKPQSE